MSKQQRKAKPSQTQAPKGKGGRKTESAPKKTGRPSGYEPDYPRQAKLLYEKGWTDLEVAQFFNVHLVTIYRWQLQYPEFCKAVKMGKELPDDRVERSLYHRAIGYTFESEKIFQFQGKIIRAKTVEHVPPSDTAAIFWLKNRRKADWRDKNEVESTQNVNVTVTHNRDAISRKLSRIAHAGTAGELAEQLVAGRARAS